MWVVYGHNLRKIVSLAVRGSHRRGAAHNIRELLSHLVARVAGIVDTPGPGERFRYE